MRLDQMRDIEVARFVARDQIIGITARVGEAEPGERPRLDAVEHQVAILAIEYGAALATDRVELDRLAFGDQFRGAAPREARDVGVERAGQPLVAGRDDEQVDLVAARAREQLGRLRPDRDLRRQARDHRFDPLRVRTTGLRRLLRTAQFRGGDHLHRLSDLLGGFDRPNSDLQSFKARHFVPSCAPAKAEARAGFPPSLEHMFNYAYVLAKASSAALSFARVSSLKSFESRIALSTSLWLARRSASIAASRRPTASTATTSRYPC